METFELRYFLAAANNENIHQGAGAIHVSPGSISKAISRLETELGVKLFYHEGRNIKLTHHGHFLKQRANAIIQMEEDTKLTISGDKGSLNIQLGADEILHSFAGIKVIQRIRNLYPQTVFHLSDSDDKTNLQKLMAGEVHLALITTNVPKGLKSKTISDVKFRTWASPKHPLVKGHKKNRVVTIEEVLAHPFVVPDTAILGKIPDHGFTDGWRDDKFPRIHAYRVQGLKVMENYVRSGMALAYLPEYYFEDTEMLPLEIIDCGFSCVHSVKLVCKNPDALGWLTKVWDEFKKTV